jgi:thiol-disulfide isomerase/thioredoxin
VFNGFRSQQKRFGEKTMRCCFAGIFIVLVIASSVGVAQGPIFTGPGPKPKRERHNMLLPVGDMAPDWQLSDALGETHTLSKYRGKVVVMDFWATWCGPCATIMPRIQKLHEKFGNREVVVFGVNSWERNDPVAVMKKKGYSYELLLKGEDIAEAYKVTTLPVVYIIGVDGKIIYCHEGLDHKNLASVIEKYFKENGIGKAS